MALRFDALFITPDAGLPKRVSEGLWPNIQFVVNDRATTLPDAFQKLVEHSYSICFIAPKYTDGIETFFKDMQTLGRDETCFFFQLEQGYDPSGEIPKLIHGAIAGLVSATPTSAERAVLVELLEVEFHRAEVARRVTDVKDAVSLLVREIDLMARDRQRGRPRRYDISVKSFVELHLAFDKEVFSQYIDALTTLASAAPAFDVNSVAIPDAVLEKKLPNLTKDSYTGPSTRVWSKLLKKFGQRVDSKPS
jgi:hypothetical protein